MQRALNTGDTREDRSLEYHALANGAARLLFSMGTTTREPITHGANRWRTLLQLRPPTPIPTPANKENAPPVRATDLLTTAHAAAAAPQAAAAEPDDYGGFFECRMSGVVVRSDVSTYYYTESFVIPSEYKNVYVTRVDAILQPESRQFIHHFTVLASTEANAVDQHMVYAWAPGARPLTFPSNAGIDLRRYEVLSIQVHYDNPRYSKTHSKTHSKTCLESRIKNTPPFYQL